MIQYSAADPSSPSPPGSTEEEEELQLLHKLTFWGVLMFCWWIFEHIFIIVALAHTTGDDKEDWERVLIQLLAMWLILWQHYVVLPVYWLNPKKRPTATNGSKKCAIIVGLLLIAFNLLFCFYFAFVNWIVNYLVNPREFMDGPWVILYHIGTILAWFSFFYLMRMAYLMWKLYRMYRDRQRNLMQQAHERGGDQEEGEGGEGDTRKNKITVEGDSNLESTNVIGKEPDTGDKDIEATA